MLRALKIHLPFAGNHTSRRRRNRFAPSITGSASSLEDRALLSAAGGSAHAAVAQHAAARDLAETPAGRHVTNLYESILHTAPTTQQVNQWVHKIRSGESINGLRRQLTAEARAQASMQAAIAADPTVSVSPTGGVTVVGPTGTTTSGTSVTGTIAPSSTIGTINPASTTGALGVAATLPGGLINSVVGSFSGGLPAAMMSSTGTPSIATGMIQVPIGASITAPSGTGVSVTIGTTTTTSNSVSGNTSTSTLSQTNVLPSSTTGSTTSPLGSLLTTGTVPTAGLNSTTTGTVPVSTLTFTPTSTTTGEPVSGTSNPSPLPLNGTLPFTGTPANPSPLPLNGTLPFTGTPANSSPVPLNGTLPFTGTPANPSPLPLTGTLA